MWWLSGVLQKIPIKCARVGRKNRDGTVESALFKKKIPCPFSVLDKTLVIMYLLCIKVYSVVV
jgi:hypothetical protein